VQQKKSTGGKDPFVTTPVSARPHPGTAMTDEQRANFERDGFIVVHGVLSEDEVAHYAAAVDRVYEEHAAAGKLAADRSLHKLNAVGSCHDLAPLLDHPRVLGVGEIGLNKNTRNEITVFEEQVDVAARYDQLILIHTPHLDDKHKGTSIITSILKNDRRIRPERVLIDHCEEHTIRMARDNGFWAGLTVYPVTKITPQRGADILEQFGPQMICVNSASDWGESGPSNLTDTALEYLRRGHTEQEAIDIFHNNPCRFFGQCPKWNVKPVG